MNKIVESYCNEKLSIKTISKNLGISPKSVSKVLKDNNVKLRSIRESKLSKTDHPEYFTKEWLYRKYHIELLSIFDISLLMGIHKANVYEWMHKFNIDINNKQINDDRYYVYFLLDSRIELNEFIDGVYIRHAPFYIGYGKNDRCFVHYKLYDKTNKRKCSVISDLKSCGYEPNIVKLKENMSIFDAMNYEKELIRKYRKKFNLTNVSDGGEIGGSICKPVSCYIPSKDGYHMIEKVYESLSSAQDDLKISKIILSEIDNIHICKRRIFTYGDKNDNIIFWPLKKSSIKYLDFTPNSSKERILDIFDNNGDYIESLNLSNTQKKYNTFYMFKRGRLCKSGNKFIIDKFMDNCDNVFKYRSSYIPNKLNEKNKKPIYHHDLHGNLIKKYSSFGEIPNSIRPKSSENLYKLGSIETKHGIFTRNQEFDYNEHLKNRKSKNILNVIIDGTTYNSFDEASKLLKVSRSMISYLKKRGAKSYNGMIISFP